MPRTGGCGTLSLVAASIIPLSAPKGAWRVAAAGRACRHFSPIEVRIAISCGGWRMTWLGRALARGWMGASSTRVMTSAGSSPPSGPAIALVAIRADKHPVGDPFGVSQQEVLGDEHAFDPRREPR